MSELRVNRRPGQPGYTLDLVSEIKSGKSRGRSILMKIIVIQLIILAFIPGVG